MITIFNLIVGFSGGQSTAINDVLFDIGPIYRNDTALSLNAIPVGVSLLQSRWEIRDMETNALVGASLSNLASIPVTVEGFHKIIFVGQTTTDEYRREWDDILILNRKFTEAEADVVVDLANAAGGYYNDFAEADNSGLKIYVKNSGSVPYFSPINLWGSSGGATKFANYVRIQKEIGNTDCVMTSNGGQPGLAFSGNRYILVDGHNDNGTQGWEIKMGATGQFDVRCNPADPFTNIVYTGLHTNRTAYADVAAFSLISPYSQTWNALTFENLGMAVHHCWIQNAGAEGIYTNFTDDRIFTGAPDYRPVKSKGYIIAWNTIENSGNDGIQPCNSLNHRIHDNVIDTPGSQTNQYHETGISYNAGNSGKVYNNFIINAKMFMTLDSGLSPVDLYNSSTTVQKSQFYNNVFISGTPPSGGVTETISIYGQFRAGYLGAVNLDWEFFNNTFYTEKQLAAFYFNTGGFTSNNFKFFNNIVVKTVNATDYPEVEFIGPGTQPSSPVVNNLVYQVGSEGPVLFTNPAARDYRPSSLLSTAFSGSPTDVSATISGIDFNDASGLYMGDYFGAYGRSDLKTITPTIVDPNPATLTTPVSVTSITASGGTVGFEANKVGILYWGVVADGAAAPTVAQLMAGTGFLDSGFIYDFGTAGTDIITGLPTPSTAYDLYHTFVTLDWVPTTVAKVDFSTIADVIAPILSGWEVRNAFPNRLYFNSNEIITGTTYGGFTLSDILGTIPTVTGITINTGQLTDHYFTLSADITAADYLGKVAYSGSGSNLVDASSNALASFAATLIDNNITYSKRIQINISNAANYVGTSDWNDVNLGNNVGVKTLIANVNDDTGTATGFVYAITNAFHDYHNTANASAGTYISNANAIVRGIEVYNGGDNSGTLRLSGLTSGKAFDMIYLIKNTFGTGAGNVNVNGAGAVGYTTGTVERKVSGTVDGSGNIDWVITQTASNSSEVLVAVIIIIYP